MEQARLSAKQFGDAAQKYLDSPVHAKGRDLERLGVLASSSGYKNALDLGCGAGHAAYALAAAGLPVTACDLSESMLEMVDHESHRRGLEIETVRSAAESLPFEDARFCLVVTRYSAHHWFDVAKALSEACRVTKKGGRIIVIDSISPEFPLYDTAIQTVELLRDASHVRNYRVSEWKKMLENSGFDQVESDSWKVRIEFQSWTDRLETPAVRIDALKAMFKAIPEEARAYFGVAEDFSFDLDTAWIGAKKNE